MGDSGTDKYLIVDIRTRIGFFATLNRVIHVMRYCEASRQIPFVRLSSPFYLEKGNDWFKYFFKYKHLNKKDMKEIKKMLKKGEYKKIDGFNKVWFSKNPEKLTFEEANRIFNKNIEILPHITKKVDKFYKKNMKEKEILGVHYRGSDKIRPSPKKVLLTLLNMKRPYSEAPKVNHKKAAKYIRKYLKKNPNTKTIFIAADERNFIHYMKSRFTNVNVINYDSTQIFDKGIPCHKSNTGNNYLKGEEALIDCLLLSRCNFLIKTASFLSGWAKIFNPKLPVYLINNPYRRRRWFPDKEFIKNKPKF